MSSLHGHDGRGRCRRRACPRLLSVQREVRSRHIERRATNIILPLVIIASAGRREENWPIARPVDSRLVTVSPAVAVAVADECLDRAVAPRLGSGSHRWPLQVDRFDGR